MNSLPRSLVLAIACGLLGACAVGPDYKQPEVATPARFKQAEGWRAAAPSDALARGAWWGLYGDAQLNDLVVRLNHSNQTVAQYDAQYRQARSLVKSARGALFPSLTGQVGKSRAAQGVGSSNSSLTGNSSGIRDTYNAQLDVSWEADLWGKLRRGLEADKASAQASYADLANMRLSQQSELVQDYLQLRVMDEQKRLLQSTVEAYQRSLKVTENQYNAGISGKVDVAQAQTQLQSTQADMIDLVWQRAQLENAIAVLIGVPPANFNVAETKAVPPLPQIPVALPAQLLERRPDIAAAERNVMAANANIGVAKAAYYPDLSLSLSGGYSSSSYSNWLSLPNRFWSVGPQLATTLFDGGQRSAEVERTEGVYDQTVAQYRQTVLDGFREVEDYMVELKVLDDEARVRALAVASSQESLRLTNNQYKAGLIAYLDVVTVQATALTNQRSALTLLQSQLVTSVQLIAAIGGGWNADTGLAEPPAP